MFGVSRPCCLVIKLNVVLLFSSLLCSNKVSRLVVSRVVLCIFPLFVLLQVYHMGLADEDSYHVTEQDNMSDVIKLLSFVSREVLICVKCFTFFFSCTKRYTTCLNLSI